ncbi:MAG: hypothetical protein LIO77_02220, partial [Rikenellaceae bacterium]|nr:hypothetical protein [Rikenellaceae bacterium]
RITTITPDSRLVTETFPLNLAATGIRRNDHFESAVPYRVKSRLSRPGIYRFGFAPAEEYSGITAIGIKTD